MILEFTTNWVGWGQNTIIYWTHPIGNLYEVKMDLNIKLEWSTTSLEQHVHALTLFSITLAGVLDYSISALTCLYDDPTMKIVYESNWEWLFIVLYQLPSINASTLSTFSGDNLSFFFSLFPSSPFFSLKLIHHHHLKTESNSQARGPSQKSRPATNIVTERHTY